MSNFKQIKKNDDGTVSVMWEDSDNFVAIDDALIAQFIIFRAAHPEITHTTDRATVISQTKTRKVRR